MIIGIDFDGTIAEIAWPEIGEPIPLALETIKELHQMGHMLILWTCRQDQKLQNARMWLNGHGIGHCFSFFNENDPEQVSKYNNDSRKLGADLFIDDKCFGWSGWVPVREFFGMKT